MVDDGEDPCTFGQSHPFINTELSVLNTPKDACSSLAIQPFYNIARTDMSAAEAPTRTSYLGGLFKKEHLVTFAKYCPLVTAILAPLSTLMDIPALSVCLLSIHWRRC